jgi:glycosyltransferase involved in cell wall biosynthesis
LKVGLVNDYASNVGGVEQHLLDLARGLRARGNDISTYATHIDASYDIPGNTTRLNPALSPWILKLTGFDPRVHSQFRRLLQKHRPDVLVMFDMYRTSLSPIAVAHELHVPTVLSIHNYYPICFRDTMFTRGDRCHGPGPKECGQCLTEGLRSKTGIQAPGGWGEAIYPLVDGHRASILRPATAIVVPSLHLKRKLSVSMPNLESRIEVIPNGLNVEDYDPNMDTSDVSTYTIGAKNLLYFGRLTEDKGVQVLLEALVRLSSPMEAVKCFIVGEGPYRESLEQLVHANHLDEVIVFTGRLPRRTLLALLAFVDAVVMPSLWDEPFPYTCLEAMAMSKPIVASRVGGIPEIITDEYNGFLVEPADAQAVAERLAYLLEHGGVRESIGLRARETIARSFPLERMVDEYSTLLQRTAQA